MKEIKVYLFSELSDEAKEKALEYARYNIMEWHWMEESIKSLGMGLKHFHFDLDDYELDGLNASRGYVSFSENPDHDGDMGITGEVLLDNLSGDFDLDNVLSGECVFTGYCGDEDFIDPIRDFAENQSDITLTELMDKCVKSLLIAIENDCKMQNEEEYIEDFLDANDYYFTQDGSIL